MPHAWWENECHCDCVYLSCDMSQVLSVHTRDLEGVGPCLGGKLSDNLHPNYIPKGHLILAVAGAVWHEAQGANIIMYILVSAWLPVSPRKDSQSCGLPEGEGEDLTQAGRVSP